MSYKPKITSINKKGFFVTTPIYYINSAPSVGSAYTTIIADTLARWHRLKGDSVFFLTGLDENSVKTIQAAKQAGFDNIQKYADSMAGQWIAAWKRLGIDYDDFIRTTEERHKKFVQAFFLKIKDKGDVYSSKYEGLYCEGCETFYTEKDLVDGKCSYHKKEPKLISEENFFFRLTNYQAKLLEHIKKNPNFIQPDARKNEVVSFIEEGLKDISISRPNLEWGISIPGGSEQKFWVWLDALSNYVSAKPSNWPATLHLVGKDIIRFHCVYWPAFLMSAGYELPEKVFAHGFFTVNGEKMSKSLGNVIDPVYLADKYGVDSLRYYLLREIPFGQDGDFSVNGLIERHNNELANGLGNLVNRTLSLSEKKLGSVVPDAECDNGLSGQLDLAKISKQMDFLETHLALAGIFSFVASCNKYINDKEPWKLEGKDAEKVIYSCLDSVRVISILLQPFMPGASERISLQLNIPLGCLKDAEFGLLKAGHRLGKKEILFAKIEAAKKYND